MTTQKAAQTTSPETLTERKAWKPKSPVEVVIEQFKKQEDRVAKMRTELAREEKELAKLQKARTALEAQ